jgi:short-subunit dehydrogenase
MLKNKSGHIAFVCSMSGKIGIPFRTAYCASKHAITGFADSLRAEVSQK